MHARCLWMLLVMLQLLYHTQTCNGATVSNPFIGQPFYVNPTFQSELDSSIQACVEPSCSATVRSTLQSMRIVPSAYWLDKANKIRGTNTTTAEGILMDAARKTPAQLVVFIVYDLPNRDCHAKASNGEICCNSNSDGTCNYDLAGDCASGINTYKTQYIQPLAQLFAEYQDRVPIVAIIEPDSLPNLATNLADPHCGNSATTNAYKTGITFAVTTIATVAPKVTIYIDAAHGGWLGWSSGLDSFTTLIASLNIQNYVRGFATNVANYQPLGTPCPSVGYCLNNAHPTDPCCYDPCRLTSQYNNGNTEHNYVQALAQAFSQKLSGWTPHFVIDTGRNGVDNTRADCANWCNVRGAGLGRVPTIETGSPLVDAYFWLKTPGESDGCTQILPTGGPCPRFDSMCASADSLGSQAGEPRCPEAGGWFDYQIKQLASNSRMGPFSEVSFNGSYPASTTGIPVTTGQLPSTTGNPGASTTGTPSVTSVTGMTATGDDVNSSPNHGGGGSNAGAIAGAVIGVLAFLALIAAGVAFFMIRKRRQNAYATSSPSSPSSRNNTGNDLELQKEQSFRLPPGQQPVARTLAATPAPQPKPAVAPTPPTKPAARPAPPPKPTTLKAPTAAAPIWEECYTDDGYLYYFNTKTGESVWTKPN